MVPVFQCLGTLKAHFENNGGEESIRGHSRRRWNVSEMGFSEKIDDKNQSSLRSVKSGSYGTAVMFHGSELQLPCLGNSHMTLVLWSWKHFMFACPKNIVLDWIGEIVVYSVACVELNDF